MIKNKGIFLMSIILASMLVGCFSGKNSDLADAPRDYKPDAAVENGDIAAEISKTSNENSEQPRIDSIYMIDETTGWALSSGRIIRTTNGCEDWEDATPTDGAFHPLINGPDRIGTCFPDNNTAFLAVGTKLQDKPGVVVFHTSDGGKDWDKKVLPTTEEWEGTNYQIISFTDLQNGWILVTATPGASQMFKSIYRTRDGGSTWVKISNSNINEKVSFYPDGMIFRTSDEGWISTSNPANAAGNDNQVYKTDDGGVNWELEDLSMPEEYKESCYYYPYVPAFFGKDKKDGVMLLQFVNFENIEDRQSVLYNTSDGGRTWSKSQDPGNTELSCFDFTNATHWWAVGSGKSKLYKTDNGGES